MNKVNELEKTANKINMELRRSSSALIMKVPVPIELTVNGLIAKPSTVDYSGTLKGGLSIDYDAKETKNKTSFPLANIKEHQLNYLKLKSSLGGVAFFMIHFKKIYKNEVFITPVSFISKFWDEAISNNGRKSIPLEDFNKNWLTAPETYIKKVTEIQDELRFN